MPKASKGSKLSKKRFRGNKSRRKPELHHYLCKKDIDTAQPIVYNDRNEFLLSEVSIRTRGFGFRNWKQILAFMKTEKYEDSFISQIKLSFFKFKLTRALYPQTGQKLLWIFRNLLTLEGQKFHKLFYETYLDIGMTKARDLLSPNYPIDHLRRLSDYFWETPPELWVSFHSFPLIFFSKKRHYLSHLPPVNVDEEVVRNMFRTYLTSLDVKELFVPPPDILFKVGNQLYNDRGEVKKDHELATRYDSPFLYQEFMAQPLQPREVWLPGKKLKHNNIFWMLIGRQFLKKDPTYPSTDINELWERLKGMTSYFRFDISGFGFQFQREYLIWFVEEIQELYPCSMNDIMGIEFTELLNNVRVEMPDGSIEKPVRGIGLGYYEDIKTLVVLSILHKYEPWSVYGDQGLLRSESGWDAITDLILYGFQFTDYDKIQASSTTDTSEWSVKWAGFRITPHLIQRYREYSSNLTNLFFIREHWERKNGLRSFYEDNQSFYIKNVKTIKNLYSLYWGYEFFKGDLDSPFESIGIDPTCPLTVGFKKDYKLEKMKVPYSETLFEAPYVTPFVKKGAKVWPKKIGKEFSQKRLRTFRKTPFIDSSVHYYVYPRIVMNNKYIPEEKLLPEWAEYLYIVNYQCSTGSFTYNMPGDAMMNALQTLSLASDPLLASKSGGYKVLDLYHRRSLPCKEWVDAVGVLSNISRRQLDYIQRADLRTSMFWADDPLYKDADLYTNPRKRKDISNDYYLRSSKRDASFDNLGARLLKSTKEGKISNFRDLVVEVLENRNVDESEEYIFDDEYIEVEDFDVNALPDDSNDTGNIEDSW